MARCPAHLFHTTGTRDPRLRLVHPQRAKQDAHTGPTGDPRRPAPPRRGLPPPERPVPPHAGAAYHPPAALMYILRDVLAESEHQEPNADVAWPEPLRPRPHAPMPLWLVTTDDQCTQAARQAQLRAEWVIVQVGQASPNPWTPPWHRPTGGYGGAARPTHGGARAGGPSGGHRTLGGTPARRPGVAQGTCDGATVLGKHGRRSGDPGCTTTRRSAQATPGR